VVNVPEGGTVSVNAGGNGRTVIGRLVSTNDFSTCLATLTRPLPPIPFPAGLDATAINKWAAGWFWSDAAEPYRIWLGGPPQADTPPYNRQNSHSWAVKINPDGSFEIPDVPAGTYMLVARFSDQATPGAFGPRMNAADPKLKSVTQAFTVEPGANLPDLPPQDLGLIGNAATVTADIPVAEPSAHDPVTVALATDPAQVKPGGIFQVLLRARVADGYHIYAATPRSKTFTGTSISLKLPDGVESVSNWSTPAAISASDGELIFTNSVTFSRSLKVNAEAASGPLSFTGELRFQACNDQLCWPPKTIPFSATLTVQPPL
jgi:hypothetical protein